jgi:hypothetical protein
MSPRYSQKVEARLRDMGVNVYVVGDIEPSTRIVARSTIMSKRSLN